MHLYSMTWKGFVQCRFGIESFHRGPNRSQLFCTYIYYFLFCLTLWCLTNLHVGLCSAVLCDMLHEGWRRQKGPFNCCVIYNVWSRHLLKPYKVNVKCYCMPRMAACLTHSSGKQGLAAKGCYLILQVHSPLVESNWSWQDWLSVFFD